jgi:integrase
VGRRRSSLIEGVHVVRIARAPYATRWYFYAWRGGPQIRSGIGATPPRLTEDDLSKIIAAKEAERAPDPTTLMTAIRGWRTSPEWAALSAGTKKTWGSALRLIEDKWGKTPLVVWNDPRMVARIMAWRDSRAATPRAADIGVTVLRALLEHARLRGRVTMNAALKIPQLYRSGRRAEIIWTDDDIEKFCLMAAKLRLTHVIDGLRLAALTGLRRADLVTLSWAQVGEFAITKKALKRSSGKRQHMSMPRIPALDSLLEELRSRHRKPGVETVLVNSYGDPWSGDGFGGSFNRVRDAAAIVHIDDDSGEESKKHLHDLRGTFCTKLITETDLTDREAAEIMGWAPDRVAAIRKVYVDQSKVSVALGARLKRLGTHPQSNAATNKEPIE